MRLLFLLSLFAATTACAQIVGDFSIPYKANPTGPQAVKSWAQTISSLWGTDASGNPQSIALDGGLNLSGGTLSGPDLSGYITAVNAAAAIAVETAARTTADTTLQTNIDGKAASSHTHALSDITQSSATSGQVPTWDGTHWSPATPSGGAGHVDVQKFTSSGTWTKPAGAIYVDVVIIGGGAGGSSGARGANGQSRSGGAGGGPGKCIYQPFMAASMFGTTEAVTVGGGGAGGAGSTVDSTGGSVGTAGGASSFSYWVAEGGIVGVNYLSAPAAVSSSCLIGSNATMSGTITSSGAGGAPNSSPAALSSQVPTGGGGGGSINSSNVASNGGAGGGYATSYVAHLYTGTFSGPAGGVASTVGTPGVGNAGGVIFLMSGMGGSGGGAAQPAVNSGVSANGAAGGAGALGGGGGGGGAASENGFTSGAGGAGGDGIVIITSYF